MAKQVRLRGAQRMREQGYKLVQVWLDKREAGLIETAARRAGKRLATWMREQAFLAAEAAAAAAMKKERREAHEQAQDAG